MNNQHVHANSTVVVPAGAPVAKALWSNARPHSDDTLCRYIGRHLAQFDMLCHHNFDVQRTELQRARRQGASRAWRRFVSGSARRMPVGVRPCRPALQRFILFSPLNSLCCVCVLCERACVSCVGRNVGNDSDPLPTRNYEYSTAVRARPPNSSLSHSLTPARNMRIRTHHARSSRTSRPLCMIANPST